MSEAHVLRIPIKPGMKDRVMSHLAKRASIAHELGELYEQRGIAHNAMFVEARDGAHCLFIYRAGSDLKGAGVDFLGADAAIERELKKLLIEATDLGEMTTLPVRTNLR